MAFLIGVLIVSVSIGFVAVRERIGGKVIVFGLVIGILFPVLSLIGLTAHTLMGCAGGGSSGPVSGCHAFGIEFNLIAALGTPAFVASFLTVPLGILLCVVGAIALACTPVQDPEDHGVRNPARGHSPALEPTPHVDTPASESATQKPLLYGYCPNCGAKIPMDSKECIACKAVFGPYSSWAVQQLCSRQDDT
jgi:hypothetical protein